MPEVSAARATFARPSRERSVSVTGAFSARGDPVSRAGALAVEATGAIPSNRPMSRRKDGGKKKRRAAESVPVPVAGSKHAFDRFLPQARTLDTRDIRPLRVDAAVAYRNATRGVSAVMSREAVIRAELPAVALHEFRELPEIALALAFTTTHGERVAVASAEVRPLAKRARALRRLLRKSAAALAEAGILLDGDLPDTRRGGSARRAADDCIALAALFTGHAGRIAGKTPVTVRQVLEAAEVGAELRRRLKLGARGPGSADAQAHVAGIRDRLWTLLSRRYERLWRVGAYLFGKSVDAHVPTLDGGAPRAERENGRADTGARSVHAGLAN